MAGGIAGGDPEQPMSEINVTPLVDVMLVLLVIFIIAAPLMAQALNVDLPRAGAPPATDMQAVTLVVRRDGSIELEGHTLASPAMLGRALNRRVEADPDLVLRLGADASVPYQKVAEVLSQCRRAGVGRIAFATREP